MIVNGKSLLASAPISPLLKTKVRDHGVSHGLAEAGYDIRLKQNIAFTRYGRTGDPCVEIYDDEGVRTSITLGRFTLASAIEEFDMPEDLVGVVHDKSTWARCGLSVFNTVIEPGWKGFLTLELVYHGNSDLMLPAGCGIAQVLFHRLEHNASYGNGKYQFQVDEPVGPVMKS